MLLTNRLFEREPPSREAKSIYIFCEGAKREYQYFRFFVEMDSRINVQPYRLDPHEDNSPTGLLNIAKDCIIPSEDNPSPRFLFQENDEIWLVFDVDKDKNDSRRPQIERVISFCSAHEGWYVAQSNPCFEVWLYGHLFDTIPEFDGDEECSNWKERVSLGIKGGFDSRRHPIYIGTAVENARANFRQSDAGPQKGCTELHKLGESMLTILDEKISKALRDMEIQDLMDDK